MDRTITLSRQEAEIISDKFPLGGFMHDLAERAARLVLYWYHEELKGKRTDLPQAMVLSQEEAHWLANNCKLSSDNKAMRSLALKALEAVVSYADQDAATELIALATDRMALPDLHVEDRL